MKDKRTKAQLLEALDVEYVKRLDAENSLRQARKERDAEARKARRLEDAVKRARSRCKDGALVLDVLGEMMIEVGGPILIGIKRAKTIIRYKS